MKSLPALLLAFFTLSALAQVALPEVKLPPGAREVTLEEAQQFLASHADASILDIRTAEETEQLGRLPGAKHLDYFREDFEQEAFKLGFDPEKPCLVYCALGGRARRVAMTLSKIGFKEILVLKDGFNAWRKSGKPVEGGKRPASN